MGKGLATGVSILAIVRKALTKITMPETNSQPNTKQKADCCFSNFVFRLSYDLLWR